MKKINEQRTITLVIFDVLGQRLKRLTTHKSRRIFHFLKANKFRNCSFHICVNYKDGSVNEGDYFTLKDALFSLKIFLED